VPPREKPQSHAASGEDDGEGPPSLAQRCEKADEQRGGDQRHRNLPTVGEEDPGSPGRRRAQQGGFPDRRDHRGRNDSATSMMERKA
jgi:hypothetical protein